MATAAQAVQITGTTPALRRVTLGVVVGNRGFFPHHLALSGRKTILASLERAGVDAVILDEEQTSFGAVESLQEARLCADLFRRERERIDGILVTLPNFGDERAIANTIRFADLGVPVLVHAFPDEVDRMSLEQRRDSFCGKMSVCNNLRQYGIAYSVIGLHTVDPAGENFAADLRHFAAVCRVVRGLRRMRVGMLGARPASFNTVRFSEKLLEQHGISVETLDLSEAIGRMDRMSDDDPDVVAKQAAIGRYTDATRVPPGPMLKMAKLGTLIDRWMTDNALDATAIQCWTALQDYFGVMPCTLMSMGSNSLLPSACETDVTGVIGMYALAMASGKPSALVDWNNNYADDPDKAMVYHCSNLPKDVFIEVQPKIDYSVLFAGTVGKDKAYGTILGRMRENPCTFLRVSTDDGHGIMRAYLAEGAFTADPLHTYGGYGVVRVPHLQDLLHFICEQGFEHHVSVNQTLVAAPVYEALTKYLGWSVHRHN